MDRIFDLSAVDWARMPDRTPNQWETEALLHDKACRCHKCALLFARMTPRQFAMVRACAINPEVI
jgi:hypothetical protein